tara:strand:+ start:333 stop:1319 length:987 start_codon:yes stop_codon:yes gene_type:complete
MTREELDEKLDGRRLVVSVSGGKDSMACCLHLMDLGYGPDDYDRIFFDTGWEHQWLYDYVENDLPAAVGPVTRLSAQIDLPDDVVAIAEKFEKKLGVDYSSMVRLCLKKGMFPSRVRRWCTQHLKVYPARDYLLEREGRVINVVGIRAQESAARSMMLEWEYSGTFKCDVWRPLIDWSEEDVIAIHQRHGVRPCRLYLEQGSTRVGCYPCIFSRKSELRAMSDYTPERLEVLGDLERVVMDMAATRYAAKGETFESLGYQPPTWFQNPISRTDPKTGKRAGDTWPIDKVIKWARTTRGGSMDQIELFADPTGHQGCVRWGMCDTGSEK